MDINKKANSIIDLMQFKEAAEQIASFLPELSKLSMKVFEQYKNAGFSEQQAFEFMKDYILKLLFNNK